MLNSHQMETVDVVLYETPDGFSIHGLRPGLVLVADAMLQNVIHASEDGQFWPYQMEIHLNKGWPVGDPQNGWMFEITLLNDLRFPF